MRESIEKPGSPLRRELDASRCGAGVPAFSTVRVRSAVMVRKSRYRRVFRCSPASVAAMEREHGDVGEGRCRRRERAARARRHHRPPLGRQRLEILIARRLPERQHAFVADIDDPEFGSTVPGVEQTLDVAIARERRIDDLSFDQLRSGVRWKRAVLVHETVFSDRPEMAFE